jgi:CheY-like chemotaxis protein
VLNGPSATRQLREQGCSCFVIGVTGNEMQEDKDFFVSCGADDVLPKPVNVDSVERLLAFLSSPRRGQQ